MALMSDSIASLVPALSAAQAEFPAVTKGRTATVPTKSGGGYSYDYADLADVMEAIRPILAKHGLVVTHQVEAEHLVMVTRVIHTSGEWLACELPVSGGGTPQAFGSSLTYMRRYSLSALLGIVTEADDDAAGAQAEAVSRGRAKQAAKPRPAADRSSESRTESRGGDTAHSAGRIWQQVWRVQTALGMDKDQATELLRAKIKADYGVESTKSLTPAQANELIANLERIAKDNTPPDPSKLDTPPGEDAP